MAGSQRSIAVILRAEIGQYKAAMEEAANSTRKTKQEVEGVGKGSEDAGKKATRSAQEMRKQWSTVATPLLAVGGAITAVGASALKTGVEYNSLQQRVRAGLTTMLGSAEAVNAQMEQFDAFARNSPFSRQTFLTAQQQMLAFGIETQKVIPYLEAVQDAVAASGGTGQTISEIVYVMSQISAASKITAVDLMQFGQRGIDAAELIGSQMGKTGAQIRNDITAGALSADEALDALAAGMTERFGGAAANVKNTFDGALDRVKAAWRDLSSELAQPFVGTEGGGIFTALLNELADLMRGFQELPTPVKAVATGLTGVVGAGSLAAGTFLLLAPRILETTNALKEMGLWGPKASGALQAVGKAAGYAFAIVATAEAIDRLDQSMQTAAASMPQTTNALLRGSDALDELFASLGEKDWQSRAMGSMGVFEGEVTDLESAMKRLADPNLGQQLADARGNLIGFAKLDFSREGSAQRKALVDQMEQLGNALGDLAREGHGERAAADFERLGAAWKRAGGDMSEFEDMMSGYTDALAEIESEQLKVAASSGNLSEAMQSAWDVLADPSAAVQAGDTLDQVVEKWRAQEEAARSFAENYATALRMGLSPEIIDDFASMGTEGMALLNDAVQRGQGYINEMNSAWGGAKGTAEEYRNALDSLPDEIFTEYGFPGADEAIEKAATLLDKHNILDQAQIETFLRQIGFDTADIDKVEARLRQLNGQYATVRVFADVGPALAAIGSLPGMPGGPALRLFGTAMITASQQQANGGILSPRARAFADGGIDEYGRPVQRVPQIRGGNQGIVMWGEPETTWEAYVSGKPSMRERNKGVLSEAASRLGGEVTWYANGGITGGADAVSPAELTRLRIRVRDLEADLRKGGDDRLRGLDRTLAQQELNEARAELQAAQAANRSIWGKRHTADTWNEARRTAADFAGNADVEFTTPASVERQLQRKLAEMGEFTIALAELKRRGASPWLLEQLMQAGPSRSSIRTARQLAQDTARLQRLNAMASQIDQVSGLYGQMTQDPRFLQSSEAWGSLTAAHQSVIERTVQVNVNSMDPSYLSREVSRLVRFELDSQAKVSGS